MNTSSERIQELILEVIDQKISATLTEIVDQVNVALGGTNYFTGVVAQLDALVRSDQIKRSERLLHQRNSLASLSRTPLDGCF